MADGNLEIVELDFQSLKDSLKDFLRQQNEFKDYDFEGSGLAQLLDILAYNTHYQAFYTNMLVNESFLDSAVKRDNVVSHAKQIGYIPRSVTAPTATIDVTIDTTDVVTSITIDRGTVFTTQIDGQTFRFVTTQTNRAIRQSDGTYLARDVEIAQGRFNTFTYTVDNQKADQRFIIPNTNADTSQLFVNVQQSQSDTTTEKFELIEDLTQVTSEDPVYFLQEVEDEQYEVMFGDGIVGKPVEDGNVILLEYLVTDGTTANGAATFTNQDDIQGYQNIIIDTVTIAAGGSDKETIESIRQNAPPFYQTQNRAVTSDDYKILLNQNSTIIQNTDSVTVWGGEDNDPPRYGSVFISLKPVTGDIVTSALKRVIKQEIINDLQIVSVTPEIIDPEFLFVELDIDFDYDSRKTDRSQAQLENFVVSTIEQFNNQTLEFFEQTFKFSRFVAMIDQSASAIINNLTNIRLKKKFTPVIAVNTKYEIDFLNSLEPGTLQSSFFIVDEPTRSPDDQYFFADDRNGNLVLIKQRIDLSTKVIDDTFGTIDYQKGLVTIDKFAPLQLVDTTDRISISMQPADNDIETARNNILTIDTEDISVQGTATI